MVSKKEIKPYLDANIWISYIWFSKIGDGSGQKNSKVRTINALNDLEILSPVSTFHVTEISKHFGEWFLLKRAIKDGYSFRQWNNVKRDYSLTKTDGDSINEIIDFVNANKSADFIPNTFLSAESVEFINGLVFGDSLDFPDAFHIAMAIELKCDFFVTSDEGIKKAVFSGKLNNRIKCLAPSEFLDLLEKIK